MNQNQKQDSLKEMMEILKGDYNAPVKLWVWGKVVKEWSGIIVGTVIFLLIALFIIASVISAGVREERAKVQLKSEEAEPNDIFGKEEYRAKKKLSAHIIELANFMKASADSVNARQNLLERLTQAIHSYAGQTLSQKELESRQKHFASILSSCNQSRGQYMKEFANEINPFDDPHISEAYKKLIHNPLSFDLHVCNPQEENNRWKALCEFCHQEATKANDELMQVLQGGEGAQIAEKK